MHTYNDFQSRDTRLGRSSELQPTKDEGLQNEATYMSFGEQRDRWNRMQKDAPVESLPQVNVVFDSSERLMDRRPMHRERSQNPNDRLNDTILAPNASKLDKTNDSICDLDKNSQPLPRRHQRHGRNAPVRFVGE